MDNVDGRCFEWGATIMHAGGPSELGKCISSPGTRAYLLPPVCCSRGVWRSRQLDRLICVRTQHHVDKQHSTISSSEACIQPTKVEVEASNCATVGPLSQKAALRHRHMHWNESLSNKSTQVQPQRLTCRVLLRASKSDVKVTTEGVNWAAIHNGQLQGRLEVSLWKYIEQQQQHGKHTDTEAQAQRQTNKHARV